jgi:hypothetical protein
VGMSRGQGRWAGVESDSDDHPQAPPLQSSSSSLSIEKVLNDDVDEDIISISDHSVGPEGKKIPELESEVLVQTMRDMHCAWPAKFRSRHSILRT